jgi:hypothetical protein
MKDPAGLVRGWELWGIAFITIVGSLLHFVFQWSGGWRPVALVGAVNESTWEHLKLAFWPAIFLALIEYPRLRGSVNNFWLAKGLSILLMPLAIVVLFYGYKAVLGHHYFVLDILIFIIAVGAGQLVSYRLLMAADRGSAGAALGVVLIVVMVAAFSLLTYFPPHNFLFEGPRTGGYGIP